MNCLIQKLFKTSTVSPQGALKKKKMGVVAGKRFLIAWPSLGAYETDSAIVIYCKAKIEILENQCMNKNEWKMTKIKHLHIYLFIYFNRSMYS